METKHKVVLVVFVAFFAVAVLVFLFGGKSKIERFEEDDFDEDTDVEDNEKEPPRKTKKKVLETFNKSKTTKDQDEEKVKNTSTEQPINYMKEAMNYLNSMNLPFQLKKEVFAELFSEEGMSQLEKLTTLPDVKKFINNIVDVNDTSKSHSQKESFLESPIQSGLVDIKKQIDNLTQSLTTMSSTIEKFEKSSHTQPKHTPPPQSKPFHHEQTAHTTPSVSSKKMTSENVIEGFENVRSNYALF